MLSAPHPGHRPCSPARRRLSRTGTPPPDAAGDARLRQGCRSAGTSRADRPESAADPGRSPTDAGRRSRAASGRVQAPNPVSRPAVGQQSEISAAADRQVRAANADGRSGKLPDRSCGPIDAVDVARPIRNAVTVVADRVDAAVVEIAFFDQHVERPERAAHDRIARRAIADDGTSRRLLERARARRRSSRNSRLVCEYTRRCS